ncbi:YjdF family protein, partial [Rickettsiella grylli]|uniref:YjdF family protein n=1 Tax=Rickettsiella grylli TaxID=59196 RepID=UPI001FD3BE78
IMIKLTVLFESPFWIGIFEKEQDGQYFVARTVFGAEPRDYEVFEFIINKMDQLKFSSPQEGEIVKKKVNPKRVHREVKLELSKKNIVSKAQDVLRLEIEKNKKERRFYNSKLKEAIKQERFELKQQKKKEKKRGH